MYKFQCQLDLQGEKLEEEEAELQVKTFNPMTIHRFLFQLLSQAVQECNI